jgi:hypothetical protein
MIFPDFEALLWTYPASQIEEYQRAYSLKASLLGKNCLPTFGGTRGD